MKYLETICLWCLAIALIIWVRTPQEYPMTTLTAQLISGIVIGLMVGAGIYRLWRLLK